MIMLPNEEVLSSFCSASGGLLYYNNSAQQNSER
jgi:hypothetical protein